MNHDHHKYCRTGDTVASDYFCPPNPVMNGEVQPVLSVIAFVVTAPGDSVRDSVNMRFERTELGAPWTLV